MGINCSVNWKSPPLECSLIRKNTVKQNIPSSDHSTQMLKGFKSLPVGRWLLPEPDGPILCISRMIPLGCAFTVPKRIGFNIVLAALRISITEIQEKARRQRLRVY